MVVGRRECVPPESSGEARECSGLWLRCRRRHLHDMWLYLHCGRYECLVRSCIECCIFSPGIRI
ncbi:hypothetical protein PRIPAC_79045, partial [Pristionchus pacificus]|uniref:Uncharacterized protein n=1 Tax=Pristionchus pacificus TaxID=54126 RepID=A0A2A6BVY0_PRIPA